MTVTIRPGQSVRRRKGGAPGTLGAILQSANPVRGGRKTFLLSCSHVLAPFGAGDAPRVNDEIVSPEHGEAVVGRLSAFTMTSPTGDYLVDAAIAELDSGVKSVGTYALPGGVELPVTGVSNAVIPGLEVFERGGDNGALQRAKVDSGIQSIRVNNAALGSFTLHKVFGCARIDSAFGARGDSGAIVFNKRGRALGLQVAEYTPDHGGWAVVCPVVDVLTALEADYLQRYGDSIVLEFVDFYRRMELPDPSDLDQQAGA